MIFSDYLKQEWVPALGCTEPASIALTAATAAAEASGSVKKIILTVDPKIYKNCYAVGIPNSGHKTGILWAVAIGAGLGDKSHGLECFKTITPKIIEAAEKLIASKCVHIDVDTKKTELSIDCVVERENGNGRAVISGDHTNITLVEKDGIAVSRRPESASSNKSLLRMKVARLSIEEMVKLARSISDDDRKKLSAGIKLNLKIAEHGLSLFPKRFVNLSSDNLAKISKLVCAGVYARMWGEDFPVMSLAGSGNKGIVAAVPIFMHGTNLGIPPEKIEEALALTCLITSATTHYLGTLSAVCGCSNAAGIGLAAGLVLLEEGSVKEISLAINNMVGNVTGMICDGAKIGCAMKTMTAVDAAFRAATLALCGLGIPASDGIVGADGGDSLKNMGRIATRGMTSTDSEILAIMQEKLLHK